MALGESVDVGCINYLYLVFCRTAVSTLLSAM